MMLRLKRLALVGLLLLPTLGHAAGFSNFMETKIFDWMVRGQAMGSALTNLAVSLHSADPTDTCGSELSSGTSSGYARAPLDADVTTETNWQQDTVSTTRRFSNKLNVTFPTATGNWNSSTAIPYWCMWDADTSGNCLVCGSITGGGVIILNGNTLSFTGSGTPPGQLTFTVD